MTEPPRFLARANDLWRRLADAQDAAIARKPPADSIAPAGYVDRRDTRSLVPRAVPAGGRRGRRVGIIALSLGSAVAVVALLAYQTPLGKVLGLRGAPDASERALVADARSDLPLRFADGSTVTFRAGSAGRMRRPTGTGADVVLERGSLEAHVVHAATTLWLVHAGPYRVRVTGTRFAMSWVSTKLEVVLYEGAVVVDGALLGAGVPLHAGQRLKIASGVVLIEPFDSVAPTVPVAAVLPEPPVAAPDDSEAPPATTGEADRTPAPPARIARTLQHSGAADDEWLALADRGAYGEALLAARRLGWNSLCRRLNAHRLLTLGDVARYSGAHAQARRAFESLVSRFPEDRLAADAVFSLGRLAFESRRPDEAMRWFRRYVADWPRGPLADQAAGRLVECAIRMDDRDAARNAARAYLVRAPRGPQAGLAREVMDQPADGPP